MEVFDRKQAESMARVRAADSVFDDEIDRAATYAVSRLASGKFDVSGDQLKVKFKLRIRTAVGERVLQEKLTESIARKAAARGLHDLAHDGDVFVYNETWAPSTKTGCFSCLSCCLSCCSDDLVRFQVTLTTHPRRKT